MRQPRAGLNCGRHGLSAASEHASLVAEQRERQQSEQDAIRSLEAKLDAQQAEHDAQAREQLYLRNVILRYMETEDHEGLFPVVAMCLRLEPAEVESVRERRHRREAGHQRAGALRFLFGMSD